MTRCTVLLSALTVSLLLGACSKNKDDSTEEAQAQTASDAQAQAGTQADAAPAARVSYWPVLGPLVAGTYSGACLRMPDAHKMDASVAIGADGKVSSSGLDIDFREAGKIMLMRVRHDNGQYASTAMFAMNPEKAGILTMQSGEANQGSVSLVRDDVGVMCSGIAGVDKLNTQPLYMALSGLIKDKQQTLGCLDTKNLLVRRDLDVEIDGGVIKVGDASYDIKAATNEIMTIDDAGESMSLAVTMPDKRTLTLLYDGAGQLKALMGMDDQASAHSCERKE